MLSSEDDQLVCWLNSIWTYWNVFDAFQSIAIISFAEAEIVLSLGWFLSPFGSLDGLWLTINIKTGSRRLSELRNHMLWKQWQLRHFWPPLAHTQCPDFFLRRLDEAWRAGCLQPSKPKCRASCPPSGDLSALEWGGHHQLTDVSWSNVPELCTCHSTESFEGPSGQWEPPAPHFTHEQMDLLEGCSVCVTSECPVQKSQRQKFKSQLNHGFII